jgi:hypothetical protein
VPSPRVEMCDDRTEASGGPRGRETDRGALLAPMASRAETSGRPNQRPKPRPSGSMPSPRTVRSPTPGRSEQVEVRHRASASVRGIALTSRRMHNVRGFINGRMIGPWPPGGRPSQTSISGQAHPPSRPQTPLSLGLPARATRPDRRPLKFKKSPFGAGSRFRSLTPEPRISPSTGEPRGSRPGSSASRHRARRKGAPVGPDLFSFPRSL